MPHYRHNVYHVRGGPSGLCQALNELSAQGWEPISIERIMLQAGSQIMIPGQEARQGEIGYEITARQRSGEAPPPR